MSNLLYNIVCSCAQCKKQIIAFSNIASESKLVERYNDIVAAARANKLECSLNTMPKHTGFTFKITDQKGYQHSIQEFINKPLNEDTITT